MKMCRFFNFFTPSQQRIKCDRPRSQRHPNARWLRSYIASLHAPRCCDRGRSHSVKNGPPVLTSHLKGGFTLDWGRVFGKGGAEAQRSTQRAENMKAAEIGVKLLVGKRSRLARDWTLTRAGFTLIELLVVIAIIAILAAMLLP